MEARNTKGFEERGIIPLADIVALWESDESAGIETFAQLIEKRKILLCRLHRGNKTVIGRHLLYCLRAVCLEAELTDDEQEIYDWLSENEGAMLQEMKQGSGLRDKAFYAAVHGLQHKLFIAPRKVIGPTSWRVSFFDEGDENNEDFLWVTTDYWLGDLIRPYFYADIEYCMGQVRELMQPYFSTREIDDLLYGR